jgi:predicted TIM-barrel fold metal-dependent hydrolase
MSKPNGAKRGMIQGMGKRVEKYLEVMRGVHSSCTTYDMHVHPFEVFFTPLDYKGDPDLKGLFSLGNAKYFTPTLEGLKDSLEDWDEDVPDNTPDQRSLRFFLRRKYAHTGPYVFRSLFDIAEIDKGLLLPVASGNGALEEQMDLVFRMFSTDERFYLAGSVPDSIKNQEILRFLKTQMDKYSIVALKVHPNLSAIDLKEPAGKERIECILDACSNLNLPLIIHVGRSNHLTGSSCRFAEIENFRAMNLKTSVPIVMAHGGAYGIPPSEIHQIVIPVLRELLETNENLCVDISGLHFGSMCQLLASIEIERILFGSDALYHDPFTTQMRLLAALESTHLNIEECYRKIISKNIENRLFQWK